RFACAILACAILARAFLAGAGLARACLEAFLAASSGGRLVRSSPGGPLRFGLADGAGRVAMRADEPFHPHSASALQRDGARPLPGPGGLFGARGARIGAAPRRRLAAGRGLALALACAPDAAPGLQRRRPRGFPAILSR